MVSIYKRKTIITEWQKKKLKLNTQYITVKHNTLYSVLRLPFHAL